MISHSRPTVGASDLEAVRGSLLSGNHASVDVVRKFEKAVSSYIGAEGAAATNSGTSALHIALLSLRLKKGDEVIMPSYVCSAVLNAARHANANPVLADIEEDSFNISYRSVSRAVTNRTKAVIVPHMFGLPVDTKPFLASGLCVIEDGAQALGAEIDGKRIGSKGHVSIFSFYATKLISTGHGGMLVSNTKSILSRAKDLLDFDGRRDYKVRFNYNMSDLQAALGISQLARLDGFIEKRRQIAAYYDKRLGKLAVKLPVRENNIYYRYVISARGNVNLIISRLKRYGIEAKRPVFKPLHRYLGLERRAFPVTEKVFRKALSLPIYPELKEKDAERVADALAGALR